MYGSNHLKGNGTITTSDCKLGKCVDFVNKKDWLQRNIASYNLSSGNWTINIWVKNDTVMADNVGFVFGGITTLKNLEVGFSTTGYIIGSTNGGASYNILVNSGAGSIPNNGWKMITARRYNNGTFNIFTNGLYKKTQNSAPNLKLNNLSFYINTNSINNVNMNGRMDEVAIWAGRTLNDNNITALYNSGNAFNLTNTTTANYTITAKSYYNSTSINSFSVRLINGSTSRTYYTSTGTISKIPTTDKRKYTVIFFNNSQHYDVTLLNYNFSFSGNLEINASPYFYLGDIVFSGYKTISGINYTRILNYTLNISCSSDSITSISTYLSGIKNKTNYLLCTNSSKKYYLSHSNNVEGLKTFALRINNTNQSYLKYKSNQSFKWDLYNPTVILNLSVRSGFTRSLNISLNCTDTMQTNLKYNLTFNNRNYLYANKTNNTKISNTTTSILNGNNSLFGSCQDAFGISYDSIYQNIYAKELWLIDETTGGLFNLNVTEAKVYWSNDSYYDFKSTGKKKINFTNTNTSRLRFQFVYSTGEVITRYIDFTLINENPLKICADEEGTIFKQNVLYSSSETPVLLKNVYASCYVAGDTTIFAYQTAKILNSFTIDALYYLYIVVDGNYEFLSAIDGGLSGTQNLDALLFAKTQVPLLVKGSSISFDKNTTGIMRILFRDISNDSLSSNLQIENLDDGSIVYFTNLPDPNYYLFYFNYSNLTITNTTLFKITVTETKSTGEEITKSYFNTNTDSGALTNSFAIALSILLKVFGFTFFVTSSVFGWMGIIIIIADLVILSMAVGGSWYITFLTAIDFIIGIYILIYITKNNPKELS